MIQARRPRPGAGGHPGVCGAGTATAVKLNALLEFEATKCSRDWECFMKLIREGIWTNEDVRFACASNMSDCLESRSAACFESCSARREFVMLSG